MDRSNDAPMNGAAAGTFSWVTTYLRSRATIHSVFLSAGTLAIGAWPGLDAGLLAPLASCAVLAALAAPHVMRLVGRQEDRVALASALVSAARLARLLLHLAIAVAVGAAGALVAAPIRGLALGDLGGLAWAVALCALGSAGWHCLASDLAYRGLGNRNLNAVVATVPGASLLLIEVGQMPSHAWAFTAYGYCGLALLCLFLAMSLASDLRSRRYPERGVGIFFGTFNPFHRTHLKIVEQALRDRHLDRVIIHPTVIPRLHADALKRGEITIARREHGMRVYERTQRADSNQDYFPTGNRFFEHSARLAMIELALREAGLDDRVEVWSLADVYTQQGFYGILREIKRRHPGAPLHGIHGSDPGGMWVRSIFDQSGWIYPYPVKRIDGVSATAVRAGAKGMVPPVVERVLACLRSGDREFSHGDRRFVLADGEMRKVD